MKQESYNTNQFVMIAEEESYHFKKLLTRILGLWPWFILSLLVCLTLAYLYLRRAQPVYKAVASLMVRDDKSSNAEEIRMRELGLIYESKSVVNEVEILKSYDLVTRVVDSLDLFVAIKEVGRIRKLDVYKNDLPFTIEVLNPEKIAKNKIWTLTYTNGKAFFKGETNPDPVLLTAGQTYEAGGIVFRYYLLKKPSVMYGTNTDESKADYNIFIYPPNAMVLHYQENLKVEPASKLATVINMEVKDTHRKRAKEFLEALLFFYKKQQFDNNDKISEGSIAFLNDRLIEVADELRNMEGNVEKFKSANKVTSLSDDAAKYLESSQQVDQQKAQIQTQVNIISELEQNLLQNRNNPNIVPSTYGIQDQSLSQLVNKHNDLVLQNQRLQEVSGPKNPLIVEQRSQINELRARLLSSVANLKRSYAISLDDVARKDAQLSSRIRNVPQMERHLIQITRSQNVQENLYAYLLQKREEAAVARASTIEDFQVIVSPRDLDAIAPNRRLIWAVSVLMSLVFPVTIVGIKDFFNNKVGDQQEVEQNTDVPVIGAITHVRKLKSPIVIDNQSRSMVADQIRNIRTSISFTGKGKNIKTIIVSSFQPGDGKSFISLNLAASYAILEKKTVMLEFDLRRPNISKKFDLEGQEGIGSILSGAASIHDVLVVVPKYGGNLFILPAGKGLSNPTELISGERMSQLMRTLQEQFDYIIIDTPPISLFPDAMLLQQFSDLTLIVLRQDYTSKDVFAELRQLRSRHLEHQAYLILNDAGKSRRYRDNYGHGSYRYRLARELYYKEKN